ncbi:MAG: hypothetical protein WD904_12595 [Dehalococcoidia bacterium]
MAQRGREEAVGQWTVGRALRALVGVSLVAAAVAGLALASWGVSESGRADEPEGLAACMASLDRLANRTDTLADRYPVVISLGKRVACWEEANGAGSYAVNVAVAWVNCRWSPETPAGIEVVEKAVELPREVTWTILPGPPDEYHDDFISEASTTIIARDRGGTEVANGRAGSRAFAYGCPGQDYGRDGSLDDLTECRARLGENFKGKDERGTFNLSGGVACWDAIPGAAEYTVDLRIEYYPGCDLYLLGGWKAKSVEDSVILEGDTTWVTFPATPDPAYEFRKDPSVTIVALDDKGERVGTDGVGVNSEIDYSTRCA